MDNPTITTDTPEICLKYYLMASLTDYIRNLNGGKSSVKSSNPQYITPQGQSTSQSGLTGTNSLVQPQANYLNPAAFAQPIGSTGQVLGANTTYSPYSGGASSGGGGGSTSALQGTAKNLINSIVNAYHSLTGSITPVVQDKVNQYLQTYNTQQNDLNNQFGQATGQTQNIYGARGLQDSSFLGNALDQNSQIYNQNLTALNQDKTQQLGAIGQYAQGLQSQANASADQYSQYLPNLGNYSPSDLQSLTSSLQTALPTVQGQVAGMGTNSDFLNTLNQFAPAANQGASQLAGQLQQLVTSSAPIFAKNQIAQGLVKSANLQDQGAQSYWQNYYQQLLGGQS